VVVANIGLNLKPKRPLSSLNKLSYSTSVADSVVMYDPYCKKILGFFKTNPK